MQAAQVGCYSEFVPRLNLVGVRFPAGTVTTHVKTQPHYSVKWKIQVEEQVIFICNSPCGSTGFTPVTIASTVILRKVPESVL